MKIWKLFSILLMPLKGKLIQDECNDDCKCFVNVDKNATNQLTQLRNTFLRHTAALLGCPDGQISADKLFCTWWRALNSKILYGQLSSCERLLKHFSFIFHTLSKDFFVLACVLSESTIEIFTKALFMSVFNCWLTALLLLAGESLMNCGFAWKEPTVKLNASSSVPNIYKSKGPFFERILSFRKLGKKEKVLFFPDLSLCLSLQSPTMTPELRVGISTFLISVPSDKRLLACQVFCFLQIQFKWKKHKV